MANNFMANNSWYSATFQIFFSAFFIELALITIREMWGLGLELPGLGLGFYGKVSVSVSKFEPGLGLGLGGYGLDYITDKHAPYRYASRKAQRSFNKPWLTKGISISITKKNTLYRKQLTTNNLNIIKQYKTYRNKLTHLKEISKQNYYKQAFQKCHHDLKKTWKRSMK